MSGDETPLLIVITDEVGSTKRDEQIIKDHLGEDYRSQLRDSRKTLFKKQIENLKRPAAGWNLIKTVGDSLIISLKPADKTDLRKCLLESLGSLFQLWLDFNKEDPEQKYKTELRIVCHLTDLKHVITGKNDLGPLKEELRSCAPKCIDIEPAITTSDIFGSPMNRAARLASIPQDSLFVVSQELLERIGTSENLHNLISNNIPYELKLRSDEKEELTVWAYPVPVVNVKGVEPPIDEEKRRKLREDGYVNDEIDEIKSYLNPWYVWELEPKSRDENRKLHKPLRVQFKEFQSLKIVTAGFSAGSAVEQDALDVFERRVKTNPCKLFVDFIFRVKSQQQLYNSDILRKFDRNIDKNPHWTDVLKRTMQAQNLIPFYIIFSSVPDIKTNWKLRRFFTPKSGKWNFQHISHDIYESTIIVKGVALDTNKKFFLLLFQIKDSYIKYADDWRKFFGTEDNGNLIEESQTLHPYYDLKSGNKLISSALGLIRGEFDGFVLFQSDADIEETKKEVIDLSKADESFFHKISPIFLFEIKLQNYSEKHIEYLGIARRIADFERYGQANSKADIPPTV